jgi:RNA polymerase sigma-70 factor (ECF subfamily)
MPQVATYVARRSYPLNAADVEEVVGEVLEVAWRRLDDVPIGAEVAWMIGVARNLINNARRKQGRRRSAEKKLHPGRGAPSAEDEMIADDQLRRAFQALDADDRELLLLHYWDGLDAAALAVVFDVTPGAAATRLSRASARMRDGFGEMSTTSDTNAALRTREG